MINLKSFLSIWVLIAYFFLSISGVGNDVLCIHESGNSSFESLISNDCVDIFSYIQEIKKFAIEPKKVYIAKSVHDDNCFDILLQKNIISYSEKIIPENELTLKSFLIIKFLAFLEKNDNKNINDNHLKKPDKLYIAKLIKTKTKNTIVLLT